MVQLYFLSILCNGLAGYTLFSGGDNDARETNNIIKTPTFYLVLGILSIVTGVLKLLSPSPSSIDAARGVLFFGDLIPAAAGITAGMILIFGLYKKDSYVREGELERISTALLTFRKSIGVLLLAAAAIHFLFGQLLFL